MSDKVKNSSKKPAAPPKGVGEKPKDFGTAMKKLIGLLKPYKFAVIIVLLFAVASTIFNIIGPKILGNATDELAKGLQGKILGTGGIDFDAIFKIMLSLIALYLISAGFSYIQGWILSSVNTKLIHNLRRQIFNKLNRLPLSYFDKTSQGDVLSRITNDVDTIAQTLNQNMTQIITSVTSLIGILIMMFSINVWMTLIALIVIPVSGFLATTVIKHSQKHFIAQQQNLADVNGHVEEMYGGHQVVKAFNYEEKSIADFNKFNGKLTESSWKSQFFSGIMMPMMNVVSNISYVAICILGGWLASGGTVTIGNIQSFIQYMRQFTQPLSQIANISTVLQSSAAASERVFEFLEEPEETPDNALVHILKDYNAPEDDAHIKVKGSIQFAHVNFGYDPDKTIIHDFSAMVEPGQTIAIVGPTGAGKTTIVKLLMRFYDLNSGAILVDGYNIDIFARSELRSQFGMVLQDAWQYNDTIRENIRYGKLDATDDEIYAAAKSAQVDHFVRTLPDGYDTELNEETTNISQGQKQLLTIARAILADPRVLILDEATSSVDTRTEVLIQKAMANLMKGRTSFVIAHRLSTIRGADTILCMRDGDIVEKGSHDELMALDGFYAQLYNSQFDSSNEEPA